jgi:hypothetical protein
MVRPQSIMAHFGSRLGLSNNQQQSRQNEARRRISIHA